MARESQSIYFIEVYVHFKSDFIDKSIFGS